MSSDLTPADLAAYRWNNPEGVTVRLRAREPFAGPVPGHKLLIIAVDHPARAALRAGTDPMAMADRQELLSRTATALARPGVTGFLGTADMIEDLALMGALEGKLVIGSMNRGGLAGSAFEMDDRFTGYDAQGIVDSHLDGGKMLLRIDPDDPGSVATLEACAHAIDALASRGLWAMVEPFWSTRVDGKVVNQLDTESVIKSITVASGLGRTSARTVLKLPNVADMATVMASTTLPGLILGGEVPADADAAVAGWGTSLGLPNITGLVIGRSLLYPADGDVAAAVDKAVNLL